MSDLVIPFFQRIADYIASGKEFSKDELCKIIDRAEGVKDNIKRLVHQCVYQRVIKDEQGNVTVL